MIIGQQNNRFLKRVNPEILRAKADGGESYNNAYLQRTMRSIVDAGIYTNLKTWISSELSKPNGTEISKSYDLKNNTDFSQSTAADQPLRDNGFSFDGISDYMIADNATDLNPISTMTFCMWAKVNDLSTSDAYLFGTFNDGNNTGIQAQGILVSGTLNLSPYFFFRTDSRQALAGGVVNGGYNDSEFHFFVMSYQSPSTLTFHVDGELKSTTYRFSFSQTAPSSWQYTFPIGARDVRGVVGGYTNSVIDDWMYFDKVLTTAEQLQIYNATKDKYI